VESSASRTIRAFGKGDARVHPAGVPEGTDAISVAEAQPGRAFAGTSRVSAPDLRARQLNASPKPSGIKSRIASPEPAVREVTPDSRTGDENGAKSGDGGGGDARVGWTTWAGALVLLTAISITLGLEALGGPPGAARAFGLVVFAVGFWSLKLLPEAITGLIFLVGTVLLGVAAPGIAFSGFSTSAFWLIFAGLILGASASRTGFSEWLVQRFLFERVRGLNYARVVAGVVIFAAAIALVLPATLGRVALLVPLMLALSNRLGFPQGGRAETGLVLAAVIGTFVVPITFLPANLPNIVLAGSLESLYGISLTFGGYFILHFPVVGLIKGVALVVIIARLYSGECRGTPDPASDDCALLSRAGQRLGIVLALTLILWASDTIHGQSAAWVGMLGAIVCLLPVMRILPFEQLPASSIFPVLLYVGAVIGLGAVMASSGAGAMLAQGIAGILPLERASDPAVLAMMAATAVLTGVVATIPGAPAITAPVFGDFAALTGWSVEAIGMAQVLGYATPLLPYQVPPIVVGAAMAGIPLREATRVLLVLAITTTPLVLPAAMLWWGALGWH
jgi:di/tricarboxylate transporter